MMYLAVKFLDVKILVLEKYSRSRDIAGSQSRKAAREGAEMTPTTTIEVHRQLHDDRTARLHASMHRPWQLAPRRRLGTWLVAAGLRLAPDARQALSQTEAPAHAGASVGVA
jgi:hypothetical protein